MYWINVEVQQSEQKPVQTETQMEDKNINPLLYNELTGSNQF